jgi:hypothetical protein
VGPVNRSLFYERYGDFHLQLLSVVLSIEKLMCVSIARIWPCAALSAQSPLSVLPNSEAVLPLLGENLSGEGAALTRRAVASARTVAAHASALLLQAIITHACGAVTGLYAACAHSIR